MISNGHAAYNPPVRDGPQIVNRRTPTLPALAAALLASAAAGGCDALPWFSPRWTRPPPVKQQVPEPIDQLLPRKILIHGWTGTRVFAEHGGITGLDVRIQATDSFGDHTKAFGSFRFELYHHQRGPDAKGDRIAVWNEDVLDATGNRKHWDKYLPGYHFKLGWNQAIPVGRKLVLQATFESPFTERLTAERTFTAGE